jgi:hypothetical protein
MRKKHLEVPVVEADSSSHVAKAGYINNPGSFTGCEDLRHEQVCEQEMAYVAYHQCWTQKKALLDEGIKYHNGEITVVIRRQQCKSFSFCYETL